MSLYYLLIYLFSFYKRFIKTKVIKQRKSSGWLLARNKLARIFGRWRGGACHRASPLSGLSIGYYRA